MFTTIQRWGNSQGVRLPKSTLAAARLSKDDTVEVIAKENEITIRKAQRHQSLDELFAGYSGDYTPAEFSTGIDVGGEVIE